MQQVRHEATAVKIGTGSQAVAGAPLPLPANRSRRILGMRVDATSYDAAAEQVITWAKAGESRYVCVSTVHMVMEGHDRAEFQRIVNAADLVTPDGMPLVWGLKLLGIPSATRVYGPDLTPVVCEHAAREGVPVGFYGGTPEVLDRMIANLTARYPGLQVVYRHSPPFRPLTAEEEAREIEEIRASGARILFVGLGCPKQEQWMAARRGRIDAVMLGVGAAFDFLAGAKRQAPDLIQSLGLEWLFRLATEPRRLWRRYLYNNPRFVVLFAAQVLKGRTQWEAH
ncbi:WecB/TagA/CpsF family glycosyltransferase [Sphaerobacter thermophilus]|uniref:Glycosyl transferase, WecB/TagA/CpsF family n=1 Tax=Sphaerobacter thermophilus (strain ATCC 49802 / DSM 20745 / KCCM 41009 / NCIMB 13125 / S 6022) TaxID=479434 RepID=D1CAJ7_SPHTD|nr:WecB/TagA/CpsF family glycosyltransferase [Sphaerobacter thermophilus]ACZ40840.1 glycosyl transferase, WecB/TagA/CpsF family [Sphaerobacter thermophilus DSM 20745]